MNPRDAALRLTAGSAVLTRRLTDRACAWCRSSYRHDLTGWRAALGPAARAGVLLLVGWLGWRIVRAAPGLLWVLVPAWLIAAWNTAPRPAPESGEEPPAEPPGAASPEPTPAPSLDDFSALVRTLAGGGAGAHLSTLAEHLTGDREDTSSVRALCRRLGVTISPSVRQPGAPGRGVSTGVKVTDLPPPTPTPSPAPLQTPPVAVVVAGQPTTTGPATATATPAVTRHEWGATLTAHDGTHRAYTV
ncbi:hypothetical protein [Streptomyces syringium]|uniref:hypothetical protein n=1 Tax=Streptomyces syringium TaxID=76729 RepID=UPI00340DBF20